MQKKILVLSALAVLVICAASVIFISRSKPSVLSENSSNDSSLAEQSTITTSTYEPIRPDESEVLLRTDPIRQIGSIRDYLTLNYDIRHLHVDSDVKIKAGDTVYLNLEKNEKGITDATGFSLTKPTSGLFVKGKAISVFPQVLYPPRDIGRSVVIDYGFERYYMPQQAMNDFFPGRITVRAAINNEGQGRILEVLSDGKAIPNYGTPR